MEFSALTSPPPPLPLMLPNGLPSLHRRHARQHSSTPISSNSLDDLADAVPHPRPPSPIAADAVTDTQTYVSLYPADAVGITLLPNAGFIRRCSSPLHPCCICFESCVHWHGGCDYVAIIASSGALFDCCSCRAFALSASCSVRVLYARESGQVAHSWLQ